MLIETPVILWECHMRLPSVLIACIVLAGCAGSVRGVAPPSSSSNVRVAPAHGGAFSGAYSGQSTYRRCGKRFGEFVFSGSGSASFLGRSVESGTIDDYIYSTCSTWQGQVFLQSSKHPDNSLSIAVYDGTPCKKPFKYSVVAGYGKFAGATGSGSVLFTCTKNYTDRWSGTLNF